MRIALFAALLAGWLQVGCQVSSDCSMLGPATGLATGAAMLRVEVYPPPAHCQGDQVAAGGPAPIRSVSFSPSAIPPIDLPPGEAVVHVQAYSDAAETALVGEGCSVVEIRTGQSACLPLPLMAVRFGDGGCRLITHTNGLGKTYFDCAPTGTVDEHLAQEACLASTGDANQCTNLGCSGGPDAGNAICVQGQHCTCWTYSGPGAGLVHVSSGGGCNCGAAGDATWN